MKKSIIVGCMILALAAGNAFAAEGVAKLSQNPRDEVDGWSYWKSLSPGQREVSSGFPDLTTSYVPGRVNFKARQVDDATALAYWKSLTPGQREVRSLIPDE